MHDFDQFERRFAAAVRSDADKNLGPFEAGSVARAAIAGTERGARAGAHPKVSRRPRHHAPRGRCCAARRRGARGRLRRRPAPDGHPTGTCRVTR